MANLLQRYNDVLILEGFQSDPEQEEAVRVLQCLSKDLTSVKKIWPFSKKKPVRGVYLHGGVGRGKSMLMDLFFNELPDNLQKRRVHFHEFMIETHDWLHQHRGEGLADLLSSYAQHVAENIKILCFDEFHVVDVADAMILGRLFTALFEKNVVVVSTSNRAPDNLYEGGLQRDLFLPFIALLKQQMEIVHLDSETDYRLLADPDQDIYYFYPLNAPTKDKIEKLFSDMAGGQAPAIETITVKGRNIEVMAANNVARFSFAELCEKPLGAEDYIVIAKAYDTVFIESIPRLTYDRRNEVKRFILLIDCLYEAGCRLILSAQSDIHTLYHGTDNALEFDRTISRLMEMQSSAYHEKRSGA